MSRAILADYADDTYPTSKAAMEHAKSLWRKHWPVVSRFEREHDKGRAEAVIMCVAMLQDGGYTKAAEAIEHHLNWLCEPAKKPTKEQRSIAGGMAGTEKKE